MVTDSIKYLSQIAAYLRVPAGKININEISIPTRLTTSDATCGYLNIILQLLTEAKSDLNSHDPLEIAEIRQWIEYTIVYPLQSKSGSEVLKELNGILATRTYLVSQKLTVADIFLYYLMYNIMETLTILEKEKYINVSRWFDNLQQNPSIRQSNKLLDFNTLYLIVLTTP